MILNRQLLAKNVKKNLAVSLLEPQTSDSLFPSAIFSPNAFDKLSKNEITFYNTKCLTNISLKFDDQNFKNGTWSITQLARTQTSNYQQRILALHCFAQVITG